jgi:hypothetical protein
MKTISEKPADKVNRITDQYKIFIEGSLHSILWEILVNGRFNGKRAAFIYAATGHERFGIAEANEKGYLPLPLAFKIVSVSRVKELIIELNKEVFDIDQKEAYAIEMSSMFPGSRF